MTTGAAATVVATDYAPTEPSRSPEIWRKSIDAFEAIPTTA
jgi:hypothetical protein